MPGLPPPAPPLKALEMHDDRGGRFPSGQGAVRRCQSHAGGTPSLHEHDLRAGDSERSAARADPPSRAPSCPTRAPSRAAVPTPSALPRPAVPPDAARRIRCDLAFPSPHSLRCFVAPPLRRFCLSLRGSVASWLFPSLPRLGAFLSALSVVAPPRCSQSPSAPPPLRRPPRSSRTAFSHFPLTSPSTAAPPRATRSRAPRPPRPLARGSSPSS